MTTLQTIVFLTTEIKLELTALDRLSSFTKNLKGLEKCNKAIGRHLDKGLEKCNEP